MRITSNQHFDVIIPVGPADIGFVGRVIDYVWRCFAEADCIYILTARKNFSCIKQTIKDGINYQLLDENELVDELDFKSLDKLLRRFYPCDRLPATGWYLQQFLKLGFARSPYSRDFYLSWDADTLPLAPIKFFSDGHVLFNPKQEYNPNYFRTQERVLGYGRQVDHSFISENMMFSREIVCQMLTEIEASAPGETWIERIVSSCDFSQPFGAFSEFEFYGNYCQYNYPNLFAPRTLNTFREAGLIRGRNISEHLLRRMSFDLDTASFERLDMPAFPYNIPNLWQRWTLKIKKISRVRPNQIISIFRAKVLGKNAKKLQKTVGETLYRLPEKRIDKDHILTNCL